MAEAYGLEEQRNRAQTTPKAEGELQDPVMPHRVCSRKELDQEYPAVIVPEEEHGEDAEQDDPMLKEGRKVTEDIIRKALTFGRRKDQKE